MKNALASVLVLFMLNSSQAQLANTRWKTTLNIDGPRNVIFDFKKDTLTVYNISDSGFIESMVFTDKDQVLTMQKITGQSDCDNATIGRYKYTLNHDTIRISLISDDCPDRSNVVAGTKWFRWKNHPAVKVDASILKNYVGTYKVDSKQLIVSLEAGVLMIEGPTVNLPKLALIPESKTRFFLKEAGVELDFIKDAQGKTTGFVSHEENDVYLKKIK